MSLKALSESIGVRRDVLEEAQWRMKVARHDAPPAVAFESDEYIWTKHEKRSDATSDEILALANRYWRCDDVSRTSGKIGDRNMWCPSKAKDALGYPRRQLFLEGGGDTVYQKFLTWAPYLAYKAESGENFNLKDSRRTAFLQTRCPCLALPNMEQCMCEIHAQQSQYLGALAYFRGTIHTDCSCECVDCKEG